MNIVTNKKKKVITIRLSETQVRDILFAIQDYLRFKESHELVGIKSFSTEDDNIVLRFIVDPLEEVKSLRSHLIYRDKLESGK